MEASEFRERDLARMLQQQTTWARVTSDKQQPRAVSMGWWVHMLIRM